MARCVGDRQAGQATQARHRPNHPCRKPPLGIRRKAMTSSLLHDAEHWRQRARDVTALASSTTNPHVRQTMTEIAQSYIRLAALADSANARAMQPDPSLR